MQSIFSHLVRSPLNAIVFRATAIQKKISTSLKKIEKKKTFSRSKSRSAAAASAELVGNGNFHVVAPSTEISISCLPRRRPSSCALCIEVLLRCGDRLRSVQQVRRLRLNIPTEHQPGIHSFCGSEQAVPEPEPSARPGKWCWHMMMGGGGGRWQAAENENQTLL